MSKFFNGTKIVPEEPCKLTALNMYIFDTKELKEALDKLTPNNAQGEYYLPDTLTIIKNKGLKVDAFALDDPEDITGVNDQEQLAAAAEIIRTRRGR